MIKPQPGDILVFRAGDDWVGKSIAWLTDSDVSHSAMMMDGGKMVEMGSSGIHVGNVKPLDGDNALLLRLCPEKDPAPLLSAAQKYIDCETRYDFPALAFLAGLIVYRRIRPTARFVAITDLVLRAACKALDGLIQSIVLRNPGQAMVCSQLVYQVYEDCGKAYHIAIDGGLLQANDAASGGIRLVDLAGGAPDSDLFMGASNALPDEQTLAKELYQALTEPEPESNANFSAPDLGALSAWVDQFLEKLEAFLEKSGSSLPIDALFIAPSDLAYKSTNLKLVGKLDIARTR